MKNRPTTIALAAVLAAGLTSASPPLPRTQLSRRRRRSRCPKRAPRRSRPSPARSRRRNSSRKQAAGGLRYSFDIATAAGTREVGIDAKTGAVLENSADNAPASQAGGEQKDADGN